MYKSLWLVICVLGTLTWAHSANDNAKQTSENTEKRYESVQIEPDHVVVPVKVIQ